MFRRGIPPHGLDMVSVTVSGFWVEELSVYHLMSSLLDGLSVGTVATFLLLDLRITLLSGHGLPGEKDWVDLVMSSKALHCTIP